LKSIKHNSIVSHISKMLIAISIDRVEIPLLMSVDSIAKRVLNGRKSLKRSTDIEELNGRIIVAVWEESYIRGLKTVTNEISKAIEKNGTLYKNENFNVESKSSDTLESGS